MKRLAIGTALIMALTSVSAFAQLTAAGGDKAPKVGDMAPDFALTRQATSIQATSLKDLESKGKKTLLMFFPGAFTQGCTTEFTEAGQKYDQITSLNIEMIGISRDLAGAQSAFGKSVGAKNGFLADPDMTVINMYDAVRPNAKPAVASRFYFLIDEKGKVIWESTTGQLIPTDKLIETLKSAMTQK